MAPAVAGSNDAFGGGGLYRSAPPTNGPTGSFGALSGIPGGGPVGGVNPPTTPFFARPNEGTNIRIPYSRVVPLSDPRGGGLTKATAAQSYYSKGYHSEGFYNKNVMCETDTLMPSRLAFVLAKRSGGVEVSGTVVPPLRKSDEATLQDITYAINSSMAPQLSGVDRFQKLCSFEYLQRYVHVRCNVATTTRIALTDAPGCVPPLDHSGWKHGLLHDVKLRAHSRVMELGKKGGGGGWITQKVIDAINDIDAGATLAKYNTLDTELRKALNDEIDDRAFALTGGTIAPSLKEEVINSCAGTAQLNPDEKKTAVGYTGLPDANATLSCIGDLAKGAAEWGSALHVDPCNALWLPEDPKATRFPIEGPALTADAEHSLRAQGIFAMDKSAFLRGKGVDSEIVDGTNPTLHGHSGSLMLSRNLGDEVAFAMLEEKLVAAGLFDWTPDGILLSKLDNVPEDALEDQRIDARDGMLYNLSIQGPCLSTNWTGAPSMTVLPNDKVFVVVVADCWHGPRAMANLDTLPAAGENADGNKDVDPNAKNDTIAKWFENGAPSFEQYERAKKQLMDAYELTKGGVEDGTDFAGGDTEIPNPHSETVFDSNALKSRNAMPWTAGVHHALTNFRLRLTTSSEMIHDSNIKFAEDVPDSKQRTSSRMGLRISNRVTEYVVGGWCIGTILDSAASRASGSLGANLGVRTAPNTAAHSLYVNIEWWSGDRLYRSYANVEDLTRSRHDAPARSGEEAAERVPESAFACSNEKGVLYKLSPQESVNRTYKLAYAAPEKVYRDVWDKEYTPAYSAIMEIAKKDRATKTVTAATPIATEMQNLITADGDLLTAKKALADQEKVGVVDAADPLRKNVVDAARKVESDWQAVKDVAVAEGVAKLRARDGATKVEDGSVFDAADWQIVKNNRGRYRKQLIEAGFAVADK